MKKDNPSKEDAIILAKAVIEEWQDYDDGDYSPVGNFCKYCYQSSWQGYDKIKHDLDCPVLVAKDVLVGEENI
jgi:hypothetical protein